MGQEALHRDVDAVSYMAVSVDESEPQCRAGADYTDDDAYNLIPLVSSRKVCTALCAASWANKGTRL